MSNLHGYYLEDLAVGMSASFTKTITEADIVLFAGVSGDTNPVHLDHHFAEKTIFKSRIAHGILTASLISTVVGTKLPGPGAIYVSQSLQFKAPVRIGDTVEAEAKIKEIITAKKRVILETICRVGSTIVIEGEAIMRVNTRK